jgi:CMP-N-acetylneuraminic acid synthetase
MLPGRTTELDSPFAVALIPARGGSKGVPLKNMQTIGSEPLIARAIRTCYASHRLDAVYVSTDNRQIGIAARQRSAEVLWRPPVLADDAASTVDVLLDAVPLLPPETKILVLVQCTAPLMTADDIDGTIRRLVDTGADMAVAVANCHDWLCRVRGDGRLEGMGWEFSRGTCRRQDMPPQFALAGSVWAIDLERFVERGTLYTSNCVGYEVERKLDIDTPADLEMARLICRKAEQQQEYYPH